MSPVKFFQEMWWAATRCGPTCHEGRRWTPLLIGSGYTEADALAKAEELGLIATTGRAKLRQAQ